MGQHKDLAKASRGRGASAGPIDTKINTGVRELYNTNKWSTGYLTPEGNLMKDELDLLSDEEIKNKAIEKK